MGINQIADVNIDKINKPYLPIPSKVLSMQQAKYIVITALLLSLGSRIIHLSIPIWHNYLGSHHWLGPIPCRHFI
ncbi:MAG: UbiA family prenyltransferase [Saprospiraceae bacterium]|nr:UbiA family prenyltransferase [Candidatus Vicinibacter affinis]